jgi:hypothetical protein
MRTQGDRLRQAGGVLGDDADTRYQATAMRAFDLHDAVGGVIYELGRCASETDRRFRGGIR